MIVDRQTRRLAMLRVYRAVRNEDTATLYHEDLEREWGRTGLRHADLEAALREMVQRHLLSIRDEGPRRNYQLTAAGVREFHNARDALRFHSQRWLTLVQARARQLWARLAPPPPRTGLQERRHTPRS